MITPVSGRPCSRPDLVSLARRKRHRLTNPVVLLVGLAGIAGPRCWDVLASYRYSLSAEPGTQFLRSIVLYDIYTAVTDADQAYLRGMIDESHDPKERSESLVQRLLQEGEPRLYGVARKFSLCEEMRWLPRDGMLAVPFPKIPPLHRPPVGYRSLPSLDWLIPFGDLWPTKAIRRDDWPVPPKKIRVIAFEHTPRGNVCTVVYWDGEELMEMSAGYA